MHSGEVLKFHVKLSIRGKCVVVETSSNHQVCRTSEYGNGSDVLRHTEATHSYNTCLDSYSRACLASAAVRSFISLQNIVRSDNCACFNTYMYSEMQANTEAAKRITADPPVCPASKMRKYAKRLDTLIGFVPRITTARAGARTSMTSSHPNLPVKIDKHSVSND